MGLFSMAGRNIGMRGLKGGLMGGAMGAYASDGDMYGIAGGAAGGAAFGMFGMGMTRGLTGRMTGAMGMAGDAGLRAASTIGNRGLFNAAMKADRGLTRGAAFLGANQANINKYGGSALAALGIGSSAYIGSSLIQSNRGYMR